MANHRRADRVLQAATISQPDALPKRPQVTAPVQRDVFKLIAKLESRYGSDLVLATLRRYLNYTREQHRLRDEIRQRERELADLQAKERRKR